VWLILPSHRLDLNLVPADPATCPRDRAADLLKMFHTRGVTDKAGWASSGAGWLVQGGFRRIRLDDPGRLVLYSNQIGGFRVGCPHQEGAVVGAFREALIAWRAGGPRALVCPACGESHALEDLAYAPAASFGQLAVVISEVEDADITSEAAARVTEVLGPWRLVRRRV